jgi:DNA-binding IclR family transcriptional regulator
VNRELITRVRMEYLEMPGLRLTSWQAQRLWNMDQATCDEILATLVREQFLSRTRDGAYLRLGTGREVSGAA